MITISVSNQKGGVGKTTTAVNLADALTHFGQKVLFLDLDPQHNATSTYGAQMDDTYTIVDVLKKDCKPEEAIQHMPLGDIIAGDELLAQEETYFINSKARETILKRTIIDKIKGYDYCIIDTPPNLGIYMTNALCAADGCIIPIKAEQYAIDGLGLLINSINEIKDLLNENLRIYGVVLNVFDSRNKLDRDVRAALPVVGEQKGFRVFEHVVRISQDVKKVQSIGRTGEEVPNRSLFENYSSSNAAIDYVNITKELLEEINNG